jgi:hypothetical protein
MLRCLASNLKLYVMKLLECGFLKPQEAILRLLAPLYFILRNPISKLHASVLSRLQIQISAF